MMRERPRTSDRMLCDDRLDTAVDSCSAQPGGRFRAGRECGNTEAWSSLTSGTLEDKKADDELIAYSEGQTTSSDKVTVPEGIEELPQSIRTPLWCTHRHLRRKRMPVEIPEKRRQRGNTCLKRHRFDREKKIPAKKEKMTATATGFKVECAEH